MSATALQDERLVELLGDAPVGAWALGPGAIELLGKAVRARQPDLALEFGSGTSTVCIAYFLGSAAGKAQPIVVSMDQDADHVARTTERLLAAGLGDRAVVLHAPLAHTSADGSTFSSYTLPPELGAVIGDRRASFVLIDGPAAEAGARYTTVVGAREWLAPGADVFLDDALRDGELDTARRWASTTWLRVQGVVLRDKGVLRATVLD